MTNGSVKKWHGWLFSRYIIFPLLLLALNFCFSLTKNNGEKYAKDYIANSMVVKLYVNDTDYHTKLITVGFFRFGSGCLKNTEITFLNKSDNRYYRIYVIRSESSLHPNTDGDGIYACVQEKRISAWVNRDEYRSKQYGTKENPIPIFNLKAYEHDGREIINDGGTVRAIPSHYEESVERYLTYIMSKDEFKRRFEH